MAISVVNTYHNSATGSATVSVTITAPTAGNALIAVAVWGVGQASASVISITGGGVTFTSDIVNSNLTANNEIWAGLNSSGSGTTITATFAGAYGTKELWVLEVSGMVTSAPRTDGTNSSFATSPGNPNLSAGSITPSAGVDVLMVLGLATSNTVTTPPAGFTSIAGSGKGIAYYKIQTSPSGSYNPAWVFNTNYFSASATIAAYRSAGGGGGFTAKFRKTLSTAGTGVGKRQAF